MFESSQTKLRIGLLNMMADGALRATERQFRRLLTPPGSLPEFQLEIFSLPELERSPEAARYIAEEYRTFAQIRRIGLEALIITGINLSDPCLEHQSFWQPLSEVMVWAGKEVPSTLCSCLATHAVMQSRFGQKRSSLNQKLWGVFSQVVVDHAHPLTAGLPTTIAVPHSRHNDVSAAQFQAAGLDLLIADEVAGVHLAATPGLKLVVMQGHPEYDPVSLLKEYKREVGYFRQGFRPDYPQFPERYFTDQGRNLLEKYRHEVEAARRGHTSCRDFPEATVVPHLVTDWVEPAGVVFANWLAAVIAMRDGQ